ncbi:MAG: hypothetical protein K2H18_00275, partial [Muribaculaceae bacterium]|nr:hypothetical protein [Muribaculaceae bacterium]
ILALAGLSFAYCNADLLVNESFDYSPGNLASSGNWVVNGSTGSYPINIMEGNLTFPGYQDEAKGASVALDMSLGKNSAQNIFAPVGSSAPESVVYSALVKVEQLPTTSKYGALIVLTGYNSIDDNIGDGVASTEGCGLYIKKGSEDTKAIFGVSVKGSANGFPASDISWSDTEFDVNETVLVALKYEKSGDDYVATLFLNPTEESTEPAAVSTMQEASLRDIRGIALCQRSALTGKNPQVTVDELRVATEWSELFNSGDVEVKVPVISVSENTLDFGQVYEGLPYKKTVNIKGADLEGDITVAGGENSILQFSTETIAKEEAMGEDGLALTITLVPGEKGFLYDKIILSSEKAIDRTINVEWRCVPLEAGTTKPSFDLNVNAPADAEFSSEFVEADHYTDTPPHYLITIGSKAESVDVEFNLPESYDTMFYRSEGAETETRAATEEDSAGFKEGKVITVNPDGTTQKYTLIFAKDGAPDSSSITNLKIKAGLPTGVNEIETDSADAVFYTIDGLKADKPEKGLYLMRKNGKTVKVIKK